MKYLPFENITYRTKLNLAEVTNRLNDVTEPWKLFHFNFFGSKKRKPYQGHVNDDGFKLTRIIRYRNSFLPVIKGTFIENGTGLEINVRMRLHPSIIVFLCIWVGFGLTFAIISFVLLVLNIKSIKNYNLKQLMPGFIPFGIVIFMFVFTVLGFKNFKFESNESKNYFKTLFEAEIVEN